MRRSMEGARSLVRLLRFSSEPGSVRLVEIKGRRRSRRAECTLGRRNAELGDPEAPRRDGRFFELAIYRGTLPKIGSLVATSRETGRPGRGEKAKVQITP